MISFISTSFSDTAGISLQVASALPIMTLASILVDYRAEVHGEGDKAPTADSAGDLPVPIDERRHDELARLGAQARHSLPQLPARVPAVHAVIQHLPFNYDDDDHVP